MTATRTILLRPLEEGDLSAADAIFRDAFSTFLRIPAQLLGDAELVRPRFEASRATAFAAEYQGELIGSIFVALRGSVAIPGPVTVRPRGWTGNAGGLLMEKALQVADASGARQVFGYTFAQSTTHVEFHQKHGFWPRFLTATVGTAVRAPAATPAAAIHFGAVPEPERAAFLAGTREVTGSLYEGLDWTAEILSVQAQRLGDTVAIFEGSRMVAFAILHVGKGSEAGTNKAYVKFLGVRPGPHAEGHYAQAIDACLALAGERGARQLSAGVNVARTEAYRTLLDRGFGLLGLGVNMARPDEPAWMRPGLYVLDDCR